MENGQVGWELQRSLLPLGELIALDRQTDKNGYCGDLSDLKALSKTIKLINPNIIVNAGAYTAVDKAETEQELAYTVNAKALEVMAKEVKLNNGWLIHYSTDYVFDGSGDDYWLETSKTAPLNIYGKSKLLGEQIIQDSGCRHLIFRTSWVYGAKGNNFAKTMLRLAKERDALNVINDQTGTPTGADLIADVTAHAIRYALINNDVAGLYHLVANNTTTWFEYARLVLNVAENLNIDLKVASSAVKPIQTIQFPTPAARPLNSRLCKDKLEKTFCLQMPNWEMGVIRMLNEITL